MKPYKLYDTGGLYLIISLKGDAGGDQVSGGRQGTRAVLRNLREVSLAKARDKRDKARSQVANDSDPAVDAKLQSSAYKRILSRP